MKLLRNTKRLTHNCQPFSHFTLFPTSILKLQRYSINYELGEIYESYLTY